MNSEPHCHGSRNGRCHGRRDLRYGSSRSLSVLALTLIFLITLNFLIASAFLITPFSVHAQAEGDGYAQLSGSAQQIATAINQVRANAGLGPLAVHPLLNQAAQTHSDDILYNYNYSHWGTDGTLVKDRVRRTGYRSEPWVSENWVSSSTPDSAMTWWMNDYIHRVNILSGHWQEMGIGVSAREGGGEMIFVTVFSATKTDGSLAAAPVAVPGVPDSAPQPAPVVALPDGVDYTILPGDTLVAIASRYNLAWENVAAVNGLNEFSILQIGQIIRLPGVTQAEVDAQAYQRSTIPEQTVALLVLSGEPYTVKSGETLFSISSSAGFTWQEVATHNGFGEDSLLQIGQVIYLPTGEDVEAASQLVTTTELYPSPNGPIGDEFVQATAASVDVGTNAGIGGPDASIGAGAQVLQEHEAAVALEWEVAPDEPDEDIVELANAEVVTAASLVVESASLDPGSIETEFVEARVPVLHTVREDDTVFGIALEYEMDWQTLLDLNEMDEDSLLQPGQLLRLR